MTERGIIVTERMERDELPPIPGESLQFKRVVESVLSINISEVYDELEPQITIRDALTPQAIRSALNKADDNALKAHRIYTAAKVEFERRKLDLDKVEGAMRERAVSELSFEKESGYHKKVITEADVRARMSTMFPDQYYELQEAKLRAETTISHLERLADCFQSRCYALKSLNDH